MNIFYKIVLQAKKPTGLIGSLMVKVMNRGHGALTDWGLGFLTVKDDDIILDVGCGGGRTINKLARAVIHGKIYGIDYSDISVKSSSKMNDPYIRRGKVEIRQASVSSIPYHENFFNAITAVETYYLWPDLENDMREVLRVLKPGGKLLIISELYDNKQPHTWADMLAFFKVNINDILAYQTREEFNQLLIDAGYVDIEIHEDQKKGWISGIGTKP